MQRMKWGENCDFDASPHPHVPCSPSSSPARTHPRRYAALGNNVPEEVLDGYPGAVRLVLTGRTLCPPVLPGPKPSCPALNPPARPSI